MEKENPNSGDFSNFIAFTEISYGLYERLLNPFEEEIKDKQLIIIPDNVLLLIPYEVLLTEKVSNTEPDYARLPYLLKSNNISYSYSANLLFGNYLKNEGNKKNMVAFAPTYGHIQNLATDQLIALEPYRDFLVPIPGALEEVNQVVNIFGGKSFTGFDASKYYFVKNARDAGIIFLAMHALMDNSEPMFSTLAFTADTVKNDNGLMYAYELYNSDIHARLAVLSACNTGMGALKQGEGLMSMARAFICAGVPSLVVNQWRVNDVVAKELMPTFMKNIKNGDQLDEALRKARLNYLANAPARLAHPHYWAGYVMLGDSSAIIKPNIRIYIILGVSVIVIILVSLLFYFRKFINLKF
ncbi:MAG: CHAT domain-containing protein [Bacteroidetes bacterium]|nr:CHAT domain-containing protein [Bacteroidota bacterium]